MNVYIGEPVVVSDMQWPCPDGFHIPLNTEWQAIYNAGVSLGAWDSSNGTNFSTYLKMPMSGRRTYDKSISVMWRGYYWSSSPRTDSTSYARTLYFNSSSISPNEGGDYRSFGEFIRWIKNSPSVPTSSWTKLYWTSIESWGIFHNATDWLISISSDGTTRYTIMDKNLWATTVYNYWDTLTLNNTGNVFQWGNNYAFPWTLSSDSITSSSTKVNVTWYWPWNYYESSTWITSNPRNSSANNWNNLRWWVSQWTSAKSVEVQNIYIGEYRKTLTADLTTQSLADLQAAWWTGILQSHWYSLDSNWLTPTGNTSALYYYYWDLSTDSVIELEMTGYASRNYSTHDYQYNAYCALWLATSAVWYGTSAYMAITTTWIAWTYNASNPIWMKCWTIYQNTLIGNEVSWNTAGNVNMKFKLDLKNKKVEYTITSPVSATTTGTLTDSQVQTILWYKYIRIEAGKWDATAYSHVYTATLRIWW